jgi:hypothetical protein
MNLKNAITPVGIFLLVAVLLWFGTRNQPDPTWQNAEKLLRQDFLMLDESVDSLQLLFEEFHDLPRKKDSTAFKLIASPYLPTMEWKKFKEYYGYIEKNKGAVIASINGSGASTLTDRLAKFIAQKPENLMHINCAPEFGLALHERYIGNEGKIPFKKGELLLFWEQCLKNPSEKFVVVADNFDKINPETFFGPELWEKLDDHKKEVKINNENIEIPHNFYMMSVIHAGVSSKMDLTNEHFRRLGGLHILEPSVIELIENLRNKKKEVEADLQKNGTDDKKRKNLLAQQKALNDTTHLMKYLCIFAKSNKYIAERYSNNHQLGQWSNIRKLFLHEDIKTVRETFLNHINALEPQKVMSEKDFSDIDYTLTTKGLEAKSNFFARQIKFLQDTGYFVEMTLIAATSLMTALFGWWVFRRKEQLLRRYGERTKEIFESFEKHDLTAEDASTKLNEIKLEIDNLVLKRTINYTEALYFMGFIEDKVKRIEFARNTSEAFLELMNTFMDDGILTDKEQQKLNQFLKSIRNKIPDSEYQKFVEEVNKVKIEGV